MPMAITLINVTVDPSDTGRSACSGFVLYALSGPNTPWRRIGFSNRVQLSAASATDKPTVSTEAQNRCSCSHVSGMK